MIFFNINLVHWRFSTFFATINIYSLCKICFIKRTLSYKKVAHLILNMKKQLLYDKYNVIFDL